MTGPVAWIERKLAMVEAVMKEEPERVSKERAYQTPDDEPLYCYDDDYKHPLTGDPLTVILLAEATRSLLGVHRVNSFGDCIVCGWNDGYGYTGQEKFPCPTLKALAAGWGWTDG